MSTQKEPGIEFSIVPEGNRQHFRLLELPPDLLSLFTSDKPPVLQLKSPEVPPGHELESNAALCTADKTFTVRQVSTSNELYLTQPSSTPQDSLSPPGLEAISKFESTLEISQAKHVSAIPYIKAALPTYTSTGHFNQSKQYLTQAQLFANIPLSEAECNKAWTDLACFEEDRLNSTPCRAFIPSNSIKLQVWRAVLETATAKDIDLTQALTTQIDDLLATGNDHEWSADLLRAVLKSIRDEATANRGPEQEFNFQVDEAKCVRVVGEMLLCEETQSGKRPVPLQKFIEAWADLLPEKWRGRAEVSLLERSYKLEDGGKDITFVEAGVGKGSTAAGEAPEETKSTLGAKRKWHEKFRAQKKTA